MSLKEVLDWTSAFHPPMTWLLVVVGWITVSRQNDKRETRKELRAQVDILVAKINALLDDSTAFYMIAGHEPGCDVKRASLVRNLSQVTSAVSALVGGNVNSTLVQRAIQLRQAITLNGFDDRDRPIAGYSSQNLVEIRTAAQDLISCLEAAFASKYKNDKKAFD